MDNKYIKFDKIFDIFDKSDIYINISPKKNFDMNINIFIKVNNFKDNLNIIKMKKENEILNNIKFQNYKLNINNFDHITNLICSNCNIINNLNLKLLTRLKYLDCSYNNIQDLILPDTLNHVICKNNLIEKLYINKNIVKVNCENNKLKKIIFEENSICEYLFCGNNYLTELNFNDNLKYLFCQYNYLTFLNIKNLINLNCSKNKILNIKFNHNKTLTNFICIENKIKKIYIPYIIDNIYLYNTKSIYIYLNFNTYKNIDFIKKLTKNNNNIKKIDIIHFLKYIKINSKEEICSICLKNFKKYAYKTLCNHIFHYNCISKINSDLCPLCRRFLFDCNIFFEKIFI